MGPIAGPAWPARAQREGASWGPACNAAAPGEVCDTAMPMRSGVQRHQRARPYRPPGHPLVARPPASPPSQHRAARRRLALLRGAACQPPAGRQATSAAAEEPEDLGAARTQQPHSNSRRRPQPTPADRFGRRATDRLWAIVDRHAPTVREAALNSDSPTAPARHVPPLDRRGAGSSYRRRALNHSPGPPPPPKQQQQTLGEPGANAQPRPPRHRPQPEIHPGRGAMTGARAII